MNPNVDWSKYIPAIRQIALARVNWHGRALLSSALFREDNVEVELARSTERMAILLTFKFHAPGVQKFLTLSAPATWWDHAKVAMPPWLRRALFWLKPPMWVYESHTVGDVYPGLAMPDRYGHLVFYDMEKYETRTEKQYDKPTIVCSVHPAVETDNQPQATDQGSMRSWTKPETVTHDELVSRDRKLRREQEGR